MRIERDMWKTTIILAGMIVLFVLMVWLPGRVHARQLEQRRIAAQTLLKEGTEAREQIPTLQAHVDELRLLVDATSRYVPHEPQLAELMRQLSQTLEEHKAQNVSTRHGVAFQGERYTTIPITLQFRATFVNLFLIVERIESMHRLVRIDKLDVLGSRDNSEALLDVSMQISAFHAQQEMER